MSAQPNTTHGTTTAWRWCAKTAEFAVAPHIIQDLGDVDSPDVQILLDTNAIESAPVCSPAKTLTAVLL